MQLPPIVAPGSVPERAPIARAIYSPAPRSSFGAFRLFGGSEPPTLTLMQQVAVGVIERIVDGRYPAGSPLSEHTLAEEFGVSKAPVSEALLLVESIGLLGNASRRSARVAPMNQEDWEDLMRYWDLLMPAALEGFSARHSGDHLATLRNYEAELQRLVDDDSGTFFFNEIANRSVLYASLHSGHQRIARALCLVSLQVLRYNNLLYRSADARQVFLSEWRKALAALEGRDAPALRTWLHSLPTRRREFTGAIFSGRADSEG